MFTTNEISIKAIKQAYDLNPHEIDKMVSAIGARDVLWDSDDTPDGGLAYELPRPYVDLEFWLVDKKECVKWLDAFGKEMLFTVAGLTFSHAKSLISSAKQEVQATTPENIKQKTRPAATQEKAGEYCGVSASTIRNWERNMGTPAGYPGRYDIAALATWGGSYKIQRGLGSTARKIERASPMDPSEFDRGDYASVFSDE